MTQIVSRFACRVKVRSDRQQLWSCLMAERPCLSTITPLTPPTYAPNAANEVNKLLFEAFEAELETYQSDLDI